MNARAAIVAMVALLAAAACGPADEPAAQRPVNIEFIMSDDHAVQAVRRHYGVRNDRYKLIRFYYDIAAGEFYDLVEDPKETRNLIDDPAYLDVIREMKAELEAVRKQYRVPDYEARIEG